MPLTTSVKQKNIGENHNKYLIGKAQNSIIIK